MEIVNINIECLSVSDINVRKSQIINIEELINSISENGLINPIIIKLIKDDKYEIIAGQRRYLAMKELNKKFIPCIILKIDNEKAEEISLIENIQKLGLSNCDKVISFSKLYEKYNQDYNKIKEIIKVSKSIMNKYYKIKDLPINVLEKLDMKGKEKISIDLAVELTTLNEELDLLEVIDKITPLKNKNKIEAIKQFKETNSNDIDELDDIIENISDEDEKDNKLKYKIPFIFDSITQKNIKIPENMYADIVKIIKEKYQEEDLNYF
jgi:ParB family chromosome partitioning protein